MNFKRLAPALLALTLFAVQARGFDFRSAVRLYENGMYQKAFEAFSALDEETPDAFSAGYRVLCMVRMNSGGCEEAVAGYRTRYGITPLTSEINYQYGLNLFDTHQYGFASAYLSAVDEGALPRKDRAELLYKRAYCDFGQGNYEAAEKGFARVEALPRSDYSAPTQYALGYIAYNGGRFREAYERFAKSASDKRFSRTSEYYMLECKFMEKDYDYVLRHGEALYSEVPEERRPHLARILSESYLVTGNSQMAKKYYDANEAPSRPMNRADYFYAGSLQYALGDYQRAIENFSKMDVRTDSIGQIANYQMGYSYIRTKNKVAALPCFAEASGVDFDATVKEDAFFNYAKLAFDLNRDPSVFTRYLDVYRNSSKKDRIYDYIAVACLYNRDYAGAVEAYDKIDDLDARMKANYARANYLRAGQLIANGSYSAAIPALKVTSYYAPRNDNFGKLARYWLAESYYKTENYAESLKLFNELYNISALDGQPEGAMLPYDIAYCHFMKPDYEQAAKWFDTYLASGDKSVAVDAATRRADCDFLRKDYRNAIVKYTAVVQDNPDPDNIYPYYRLGIACGLNGDRQGKVVALMPVRKASPAAPMYSDALFELGRAYVDIKKESDAVACFNELVANSRDSVFIARALIEKGMIARNGSDADGALECYKRVVEDYRNSGFAEDAMLAIESIYQSRGAMDEYVKYTRNIGKPAAGTDKEVEDLIFNSAEQIYFTEDYQKALVALQKYLDAYPAGSKAVQAGYYMAESYRMLDRKEKALECYGALLEKGAGSPVKEQSMRSMADLSYGMERYGEAYDAYFALLDAVRDPEGILAAKTGMMRSAYRLRRYQQSLDAAVLVGNDAGAGNALRREADYVRAKSLMSMSRRDEAMSVFSELSASPATDEGAEAMYVIIQDTYDRGDFEKIDDMVFDFSSKAPGQSYWLARSFVVLGDAYAENGRFKQAKATFESILAGYKPASGTTDEVTDAVNMRLEKIKEFL